MEYFVSNTISLFIAGLNFEEVAVGNNQSKWLVVKAAEMDFANAYGWQ